MSDLDQIRHELDGIVSRYSSVRESLVRDSSKYNETELRNDFLNPFLRLLGWEVMSL